jgi:hypothetical protein
MGVRATKYNQPTGFDDVENRALKDSAIHTSAVSTVTVISASGGNIADGVEPGNGYVYHTFTESGTFSVVGSGLTSVEVLLVASGGQGGGPMGGGGGAGGLLHGDYPVSLGNYTVSIGSSTLGSISAAGLGQTGSNSEFFPTPVAPDPSHPTRCTAIGGGGGASYHNSYPGKIAGSGGSGGGTGGGYPPAPSAGLHGLSTQGDSGGLTGYGFRGGLGAGGPYSASGGGGAGAVGGSGQSNSAIGGDGGPGKQYPQFAADLINLPVIAPAQSYFAAGGGGGGYPSAHPTAPGYEPNREYSRGGNPNSDELTGVGGAGHNDVNPTTAPYGYGSPGTGPTAPDKLRLHVYALDHTGSGGGGGGYSYGQPGQGAGGICCIRYLKILS